MNATKHILRALLAVLCVGAALSSRAQTQGMGAGAQGSGSSSSPAQSFIASDVVDYRDSLDYYVIGDKVGTAYTDVPMAMDYAEYARWSERQLFNRLFKQKNAVAFETQGKEQFDFTDMQFDLGPAEKVFGPGGVRITTQGTAEIKLGATHKNVENPSLPIRRRKTTSIDFDEKINFNMTGKVGDKMNMGLNYNTDATFDYDAQNMKLKYEGKEDEIIQLVEGGNVSFPSNSSLITGATSLFGIRTDLQFGKLKLQTVVSQKKSSSTSVSSKGGTQLTSFEIDVANYDENRHFFLSHYFHDNYDRYMKTLPNVASGITINRVEIWVTNTTGTTSNTRNIIALTDLGEPSKVSNNIWSTGGSFVPSNAANTEYSTLVNNYAAARDIDQTTSLLDGINGFVGGTDYEKLEKARLLSSSEYTLNTSMGYVTLTSAVKTDQVLAIAYEYTYAGVTYQVGEFAADVTDVNQALFVKSLKNTSNNPEQGNWRLMMRNVYNLGGTLQQEKFRLDVKFQSDTPGVYDRYIPEDQTKSQQIIKLLGADRLDSNQKAHSNGYFDYVEGYTINGQYVYFPVAEPFGEAMLSALVSAGVSSETAEKYAFTELYEQTKTSAKQIAEKNKYILSGQFKGSRSNVISLGTAGSIAQGSVVVTAGGVTLTEGSDYTVDYSAGEVTIINQSIIDAGTTINASVESQSDYSQMRKTMIGLNWEYNFSKDFQMSGTFQHLSEQALTTKVAMGDEPLNNTLWGVNMSWKKESQWITNLLNATPLLHVSQPSYISFQGEFAQLIAKQSSGTQDNASYLDDFENTKTTIDVSTPSSWILSSVPSMFSESSDKTGLTSGYNRSLLAWYNIDPLFTRKSSSLTPSHIKSDLEQLSNHYVREVYVSELYPNRDQSSYSGATSTLSILNLAYYPNERGPYNFYPQLQSDGTVYNPGSHWGGMMRKLDTSDFETANVEYIEFWMLDPFIYTREEGTASLYGGDLYFNLGDISEDVLKDGKKFYESGMPIDGSSSYTTTQWGRIPTASTVTYSFATSGDRSLQDVGLNGLTDEQEREFTSYQDFLTAIQGQVSAAVWDSIYNDPAADNYHYFRGSDYDTAQASILRRYKYINNPQGNSPDSDTRTESYDTSYKTTPDAEDINQDYTLSEYENYFQYVVSIRPGDLVVGNNYIVDKRESSVKLRNGNTESATWYQFRIPVDDYESKVGTISDFTSIRFMRMFMTGFENPIVLRFGSLDLVRGEWRVYDNNLDSTTGAGSLVMSAVNIEENNDKTPVNYVLPPGIRRDTDPTQPQLVESNEQALALTITNLSSNESKCVYKNVSLDLRQYKRLQMFVHANAFETNTTELDDNELAVFFRLGSDYKSNYYEYEIPLTLTPEGHYDQYSTAGCLAVWPAENMLDIQTSLLTNLKKERNRAKALGAASYTQAYTAYDDDNPQNKITVMGNPSLGEVKVMIIGVRNKSGEIKSGEVWVNELRMLEYDDDGGWAAQGTLNMQLSDLGTVNVQGRYITQGFGGLEDGVAARATEDQSTFAVTTSLELGKFFPEKAQVSIPMYYSLTKERSTPKYNPLDTDQLLSDALDDCDSKAARDSLQSIAVTTVTTSNLSFSGVRVGIGNKKHPTPIDPSNFTFSYSKSHSFTSGETTVYEKDDQWQASLDYSWTPVYKSFEPWKKSKSKNKWLDILKQFQLNYLPQNISFSSDINRTYYELQERDIEVSDTDNSLPLTFNSQFLWNRDFAIRWDLTKNIHMNFSAATKAEIEEPYNSEKKAIYPESKEALKDSVWTSIKSMGTPLDYQQSFSLSVSSPLDKLPILDWTKFDGSYKANYTWVRGSEDEDGNSYGHTITNNRTISANGTLNLEKLYNHVPFLKATNDRFKGSAKKVSAKNSKTGKLADGKRPTDKNSKKAYEKEITLKPATTDSTNRRRASNEPITVNHGKKSKRIIVTAKTEDGKSFPLKYKVVDQNTIRIKNQVDSALKLKVTVQAKEPLDNQKWYKNAQSVARFLMMVRSVSMTYQNQQAMSLSGFMPMVGDWIGQQQNNGYLAPGMGFAFGVDGESFLDKAAARGWLSDNDSVATPATLSATTDIQFKASLEPVRNLKIDLNASHTRTQGKSIQYMYEGMPTTHSGTFSMTTISLRSAFEGMGNATNGFKSRSFENFCNSLETYQTMFMAQYPSSASSTGTSTGSVDQYSSDVLIPAFLNAYTTNNHGLALFPTLAKILPNWSLKYTGLAKLPFFRNHFKSVTLSHAYKSIYAVGSYSSFSSFQEYMNGLGYVTDATTGDLVPSSMYNISTVSINEAFSPLLGLDMTFKNSLSLKCEYKQTRVLSLSTTSVQINESVSKDWVIGTGYKIQDFKLFQANNHRKVKGNTKSRGDDDDDDDNSKKQASKGATSSKNQLNHDLNLRLDFSFRKQAAICRDIQTITSTASSGNNALKISFSAEYTLSKLATCSFYYDMQKNTPLLTSSSYPTTTQDFGLSLKFSLKR